jgi:acyl-CoA synthetase (AMP-forming)/AMP-acid ligase II
MIETNLTSERIDTHNREGTWLGLVLPDLVERAARAFPDKVFMIDSRGRSTYGQFDLISRRLALWLHRMGVAKGDRVGVQLPDRIEYFAMVVAASRIGALYMPLNHQFREVDLVPLLEFSKPSVVAIPSQFRDFDYLPMYKELESRYPWMKHILVSHDDDVDLTGSMVSLEGITRDPLEQQYPDDHLQQFRPEPNDPCFILLTSGTTDIPKGVIHTHNTWMCGCLNQWSQLAPRPDDVLLNLYPMFGTSALVQTTGILYHKGSVVMMDKFTGEGALNLAEKERVTILGGVAAHLIGMLHASNFDECNLDSMRLVFSVGGPVMTTLAKEVEERMRCRISLLWGSSEATGHTQTLLTDSDEVRRGTVGRCVPYMVVKAVDPNGREVRAREAGELLVRGPNNFVGYYNNPKLDAEVIDPDGWLRTGDVGVFDRSGNLTIVGRTKDMILRGGENIYPRELEELLAQHPKVKDVAVVGAPDARLGEIVCACVVCVEGVTVTLDDLVSFLRGKVQVRKLPERIEIMDRFPMTDAGKVIKAKLREAITDNVRKDRGEQRTK